MSHVCLLARGEQNKIDFSGDTLFNAGVVIMSAIGSLNYIDTYTF